MSETIAIPDEIAERIKKHFGFLFDKGYSLYTGKILSEQFIAWEAVVKKQDFYINFESERNGLLVSFGSPSRGFMSTRALIYFLSKEKKFIKLGGGIFGLFKDNMTIEAELLKQYIDLFESSFKNEFPATIKEVEAAQRKYSQKT